MGLSCPVAAQSPRLASEDLKVPFGDGQIFVRNKRPEGVASFKSDRLVLFVHGATYSGTAFDLPLGGTSWMDDVAERGFDTYALDLPSYGRSTRAPAMELAAEDNAPLTRGSEAVWLVVRNHHRRQLRHPATAGGRARRALCAGVAAHHAVARAS